MIPCCFDFEWVKALLHNCFSSLCAFQALTGIFGVGAKTADRWIREGIRSLQQLQDSGQTLNRAQQAGVSLRSAVILRSIKSLFQLIVC